MDNVNHNCRQIGLEQLDLDVMWKIHSLYKVMMSNDYCSELLTAYLKDIYCDTCREELEEEDDEVMEV